MPVHEFATAYNAGQLSEQMAARVDTQKYKLGAECLRNFFVLPRGGIARRAGSIFMGETKYRDRLTVLGRFEFSVTQAYILEIGHQYIRFWANRAPVLDADDVPVEVETPYTEDDLRALRCDQSADVMWFAHRSHPVHKLERLSETEFRFVEVGFNPPPTAERDTAFPATLTLTATTGTGIPVTASADVFLLGDLGRNIKSEGSIGTISGVVSGTSITLDIATDFTSTTLAAGDWVMDGSPNATAIHRTGGGPPSSLPNGMVPGSLFVTTTDNPAFRSTDAGKYLVFDGGIVRILSVDSTTQVTVRLEKPFTEDGGAQGTWTLEEPSWSEDLGYPGVVRFTQQRLGFYGSSSFPDTIWLSAIGDYENFGRGALADDSLVEAIATSGVNLIRWAQGVPEGLALGTMANEVTVDGAEDKALTAETIRIRPRTEWGSDHDVDALKADRVILFMQRGSQKLRELSFDYASNTYQAQDMNALTDITAPGVVQMALAKTPELAVFLVRADGILLSLTYERAQEVVGWAHHDTDGLYESVAVIPNSCGTWDEIWTIVQRPGFSQGRYWHANYWHQNYWAEGYWAEGAGGPNGFYFAPGYFADGYFASSYFGGRSLSNSRRYLEVFDGAMRLDCALTHTGDETDTFTGLDHLEGKAVTIITDTGAVYDGGVINGTVVLPVRTQSIEVGLLYTATLKTLRPEMATQFGSIQGRRMRWNTVSFRVYCTEGHLVVNDEEIQFPENARLPFTGDLRPQTTYGWNRHGQHEVHVREPKKVTILGFAGSLQVDDAAR